MANPQFEAAEIAKHKGLIKNDTIRREVLNRLESWIQNVFIIRYKADSEVAGAEGNRELFISSKNYNNIDTTQKIC